MSDRLRLQEIHAEKTTQDGILVKIGGQLDTLHNMGKGMHVELTDQNVMLRDIESGVDTAQGGVDGANNGIARLLKKSETKWMILIAILIIILVILIVVAIHTATS